MRNLAAEENFLQRIFMIAGLAFVLGLIGIAIGTELLILDLWITSPSEFWIWQGVWAMVVGLIISGLATTVKRQQPRV